MPKPARCFLALLLLTSLLPDASHWLLGADQPQWGQQYSRNMVSDERGLPDSFDPKSGQNVKWSARLGTEAHSTPVVAGGRVYIGTNNGEPRDPKHRGDRGVLMCFDEKDGHFLWQLVVLKRDEDVYYDWPNSGISSPATVEGDRVYIVSNRGEVLCLDAAGLANGNDGPYRDEGRHMTPHDAKPLEPGPTDADILWVFDLFEGAGIWPHDAAHSSILVYGSYLYLNTGTGVDNTHKRIRTPDAPSIVVLDKTTGRLVARDNEHIAPTIFHSTWASPSLGVINGKPLIFFAGGNGVVYAFEPIRDDLASSPDHARTGSGGEANLTNSSVGSLQFLRKVWQFDCDPTAPKENVHRYNSNRRESPSNIYGMPVFYHERIYVAGGGDVFWGKNEAWLKCIDATKSGDVTAKAEIWSCPLTRHTMSTPAVRDGLAFVSDCGHDLHCVDAETGKPYWTHETGGEMWSSPLVADGKVYIGTRHGDFLIFQASKEEKLLCSVELNSPISATAVAANGVLYVTTMSHLYALQQGASLKP